MNVLFVLTLLAIIYSTASESSKNIICYFASWTVYRPNNGKFDVVNIDPNLCTHINFAFIGVNRDASIHILDPWESNDPYGINGFKNLMALKHSYPHLKIIATMGGWNERSRPYSLIASSPNQRLLLADNILSFLEEWGFDGFELDWEYPGLRDGNPNIDKDNFIELLKILNVALKRKGYILMVTVAGQANKVDISYNIPAVTELVDMINVMVYDFHGNENFVGHDAPLYPATVDADNYNNVTYNVAYGINYWLSKGAVPEKINLGVVLYGRGFTLSNKDNTSLYASVKGPSKQGPYTAQAGYLGYNEICLFHLQNSTYVWDDEQKVPHIYWNDQWIGYENERSLIEKAKFAVENKLGGMMVWSFDYDDFLGHCGPKYPLMNAVYKGLNPS